MKDFILWTCRNDDPDKGPPAACAPANRGDLDEVKALRARDEHHALLAYVEGTPRIQRAVLRGHFVEIAIVEKKALAGEQTVKKVRPRVWTSFGPRHQGDPEPSSAPIKPRWDSIAVGLRYWLGVEQYEVVQRDTIGGRCWLSGKLLHDGTISAALYVLTREVWEEHATMQRSDDAFGIWRCVHCRSVTILRDGDPQVKCSCGAEFYPMMRRTKFGDAVSLKQVAGEPLGGLVVDGRYPGQ